MNKLSIDDLINIPYDQAIKYIAEFINEKIIETGVDKVVMGLSGGVDSSTLLAILVEAIGSDRVVVLLMPDLRVNSERDIKDAFELVNKYSVKHYYIPIDNIVDSYTNISFINPMDKLPFGNLRARVRMNILYYYANKYNALVAGSSDRSEILIGYFTKYGDAAADLLPIGSLYKTQVRKLASILGLPDKIVNKPSSPGLWLGHLAEEELGVKYEAIDLVLHAYIDREIPREEIPEYTGISINIVDKVISMYRRSIHKRIFPEIPYLPWVKKVI